MAEVGYDTLTIKINADSSVATKSINALNRGLKNLDQTAHNLDKEKVEEVKGLLLDIANIDFSNVSKGLQDVVSAFKSFQNKSFMKQTQNLTNLSGSFKMPELEKYEGTLLPKFEAFTQGDLQGMQEFKDSIKNCTIYADRLNQDFSQVGGYINNVLTPTEKLGQQLQEMGLNANQMQVVFNALDNSLGTLSTKQLRQIEQLLIESGMSAKEVAKTLKRLGKESNKAGNEGAKGFAKLLLQFKNILKYRIVRKLIQSIFNAIKEGMENLLAFDTRTNENMQRLRDSFLYLKNAFASMIAPLINLLTPILETIMHLIGQLASAIADVFAGLSGQDTFAQATEDVKDLNKELKKTQALGIDELNVIQPQNEGGFEEKQTSAMSSVFGDALASFKDIISSIIPIVKDLIYSLRPVLEAIGGLIKNLMPILKVIVNLINRLVGKTADGVNKSLTAVINAISMVLEIIGAVLEFLEPILNVIIDVFALLIDEVNTIITCVAELISNILRPIFNILKVIFDFLSPIVKWIGNLLSTIITWVSNLVGFIGGTFGNVLSFIGNVLSKIAPVLEAILNVLGGKFLDKMPTGWRVAFDIATGGIFELAKWVFGGFATGGFPEDGFFFANHNELVGQFSNGKTAVANNQQITEGIYQAVRQAIMEGNITTPIEINLDGQKIADVVNKKNKNTGKAVLFGTNINYGD